jgi:peptide deformylase
MDLKILTYPHQLLTQKTKPVKSFEKNLIEIVNQMKKIMLANNGVGLAANQVGLNLSLFIARPKEKFYVFVNPSIVSHSEEEIKEEGCLSLPNKWGLVKRYNKVKINYQDLRGRKKTLKASGLLAHIIQHEVDHLNGLLFIDKALEIMDLNQNSHNG